MRIVIDIDDNLYTRLFDNGIEDYEIANDDLSAMATAIRKGTHLENKITSPDLCSSCTNIGCEFQFGIVRTKCAFFMPPHIEPDNCGIYVVMQSTAEAIIKEQYEARLKADIVAILDKIRAEIDVARFIDKDTKLCKNANASGLEVAMKIIDHYKAESEGSDADSN